MSFNRDTYEVVRFFKEEGKHPKVIATGLTLEEAREHCNNPKTSGDDWFDGYTKEDKGDD